MVGDVDCAWLTVPESRARPDSSLIQVLVTTVRAPSGAPDQEPMLVTGSAGQPNYAGIAPLAQRVRRDVIIVDTRGTGHSTPALSCPELNATAPKIWVNPDSANDLLRAAIASCHARLTSEGIDLASYDVVEAAADLETLRVALGVEMWNVIAYGAGTRLAFELLRQAPDKIRAVIVDSPDVPGTDPRLLAGPRKPRGCAGRPYRVFARSQVPSAVPRTRSTARQGDDFAEIGAAAVERRPPRPECPRSPRSWPAGPGAPADAVRRWQQWTAVRRRVDPVRTGRCGGQARTGAEQHVRSVSPV